MEIIDAHAHIGSCMSVIHFGKRVYTGSDLIQEMDKNRVAKAVASGGVGAQ